MAGIRRENARMKIPALIHLSRLGYVYLPRKSIQRDRDINFLPEILHDAMEKINGRSMDGETFSCLTEEIRTVLNRPDQGHAFYRMLRDGWRGWKLTDWHQPGQNRFHAATELMCGRGSGGFRPDITLFVNGMPLAMIEVKTRDQAGGIRAEYDRMLERMAEQESRPFLQAAQVWAFSNDRENDPDRLLPTEGAYYASPGQGDFPLHAFREMHPGEMRKKMKRSPETEEIILRDNGIAEPERQKTAGRSNTDGTGPDQAYTGIPAKSRREWLKTLSPDTPTHRMLTGLFSPERFLFLIRYGIEYTEEQNGRGETEIRRRILSAEQFFALWDLRAKLKRGYRNWRIPPLGAAGEMGTLASLVRWSLETVPESRFYWIEEKRAELTRKDSELRARGLLPGRKGFSGSESLILAEPSRDPAEWMREPGEREFAGKRIFLMPADYAQTREGRIFRAGLRRAAPEGIQILRERAAAHEGGGNYVYLVECADGTLYCGWTNDLEQRIRTHNTGKGAKYTRSRRPVRLVYAEEFDTREKAMSREWHLKRMSREEKLRLIRGAQAAGNGLQQDGRHGP